METTPNITTESLELKRRGRPPKSMGEGLAQAADEARAAEIQKCPDNLNQFSARHERNVSGVFRNIEAPGQSLRFTIKLYKDQPIKTYEFNDGMMYTIPLSVAKHLNRNCWIPIYDTQVETDDRGHARPRVKSMVQRFQFVSNELM